MAPVSDQLAERVVSGLCGCEPRGHLASAIGRFTKIEHSVFSLPLLLAGAWIGAGHRLPSLWTTFLIILAGVGARTLGMAANRIFDHGLDVLNPRTADRELPSGRMSLGTAWAIAAVALAIYLTACAMLSALCLILSPIPALCMILYSLLKRFTSLCHFGIGVCMALGPLGAFVAASDQLPFDTEIILLATFTFCWISGFDIIYALQDVQSDRQTGVHSLPATLGNTGGQLVAAVVHLVAAGTCFGLWQVAGAELWPGLALVVALAGFALAYCPGIDARARFFPISVISGVAGAMIPLLGGR